jgi:hypothetical protein
LFYLFIFGYLTGGEQLNIIKEVVKHKCPVVCMICWENKTQPLEDCIISTFNYNSSNANQHLKRNHKEVPEMASDISTVTDSLATNPFNLVQNQILQYNQNPNDVVVGSASVGLDHLYSFFNQANIAIEQANNESLKKFIEYVIDHGATMKKQDCRFSRFKYKKYELNQFHLFISTVQYLVKYSCDYYEKQLNTNSVPFLYISHDGWDIKDNDLLGVSLHFIVPVYWVSVIIAIGLKRIYKKTSDNMSTVIKSILAGYDIKLNDVYRVVNDTTNRAIRTGITISEGRTPTKHGTTCHMHTQELVVGHALGIRIQKKKNVVIDEFPIAKNLSDKVKLLCSNLMDKKAKNRFHNYRDYCRNHLSMTVCKLEIPNDTRMSGIFSMYESLLRSKKSLILYCTNSRDSMLFKDLLISDEEWNLVAETYAILQMTNVLAMLSQQDCFSYYYVAKARNCI